MKKYFFIACLLLGSVATFAQRDLGYRGSLDLSVGYGIKSGSTFLAGLSTVHGYQAAPFLFFGVGVAAYELDSDAGYSSGLAVPVFGDIRIDMGAGKFSPFIDVRCGYDFISMNGLYLSPSIGMHYAKSDNFGYNLGIGYEHQASDSGAGALGYLALKFGIDF